MDDDSQSCVSRIGVIPSSVQGGNLRALRAKFIIERTQPVPVKKQLFASVLVGNSHATIGRGMSDVTNLTFRPP